MAAGKDIPDLDFEALLRMAENRQEDSNLGFFSKPYRISYESREWIVKVYRSIKDADTIAKLHDDYVESLSATGIRVPATNIHIGGPKKDTLIIVQEPFGKEELVRGHFESGTKETVLRLLGLMYDDTIRFWLNNPDREMLGFHPTSRNYAIREDKLYYFDTFPPMNMTQNDLNKLIIRVSPVWFAIKPFVPPNAINRVTNEYYSVVKMITGMAGSIIRLRPALGRDILAFTKGFIEQSALQSEEKRAIIDEIGSPPQLSFLWRAVRKLTGNVGRPNVDIPKK